MFPNITRILAKGNVFKVNKYAVVESADWLMKKGEFSAASKLMLEAIKENPSDKAIRAEYAIINKKIQEQTAKIQDIDVTHTKLPEI